MADIKEEEKSEYLLMNNSDNESLFTMQRMATD